MVGTAGNGATAPSNINIGGRAYSFIDQTFDVVVAGAGARRS